MKKLMTFALVFSMVVSYMYIPGIKSTAKAEQSNSNIGFTISDWVLDETSGYIYAVSNTDKKR